MSDNQKNISAPPAPPASGAPGAGPSKNFNLINFICISIIGISLAFELGKKSLISTTDNTNFMENSWLLSMQTTSIAIIGLLILAISSFGSGNLLASLPLILVTFVKIGKLIIHVKFKEQLTKFELPDVYEKYNYGSNGLFTLIVILLFFYSKKAFSGGTPADKKQANFIGILIVILSMLYSFMYFVIIYNILNFWLTEG